MGKYGKYRPLVRFAALLLALWPAVVQANCRQALAIGLDISGSVDENEYRLQMDGLANALLNRDVREALLGIPSAPVRLFVYEWGGTGTQRILVPWTDVVDEPTLESIAATLLNTPRRPREVATALGQSMLFGNRELSAQTDCWRLTLDLSGDGQSNKGPRPRDVRDQMLFKVTVNAIVIGADSGIFAGTIESEIARLTAYFSAEVIRGPDAFVEAAIGFEDFEKAMARKLLKELETMAVGSLDQ